MRQTHIVMGIGSLFFILVLVQFVPAEEKIMRNDLR
jgi:hypothetical protein